MTEYLTRDQILAVQDCKIEEVVIPEWHDCIVRVKALSGALRDKIEASVVGQSGTERNYVNLRARMVVHTVVDESGSLMFNEGDVKALGSKNACALDRIFDVAQRLSGMTKEDVEDLVGNSRPTQSDDSVSD